MASGDEGSKDTPYPAPMGKDRALTILRAATAAVPYVGSPIAELLNLITSPLERRREKWAEDVTDGLHRLEEKIAGFTLDSLKDSDAFASAIAQALPAVSRTHEAEKLEALRNAVLNTALAPPTEYDTGVLIGLCETLTPWHLKVLCFLDDPRRYFDANRISVMSRSQALEAAFPGLRGKRAMYDGLVRDLYLQGLIVIDSLHLTMTHSGATQSCLTLKGNALVQLIRSPIGD
jgi:hypothetical protein